MASVHERRSLDLPSRRHLPGVCMEDMQMSALNEYGIDLKMDHLIAWSSAAGIHKYKAFKDLKQGYRSWWKITKYLII